MDEHCECCGHVMEREERDIATVGFVRDGKRWYTRHIHLICPRCGDEQHDWEFIPTQSDVREVCV